MGRHKRRVARPTRGDVIVILTSALIIGIFLAMITYAVRTA